MKGTFQTATMGFLTLFSTYLYILAAPEPQRVIIKEEPLIDTEFEENATFIYLTI